MGQVLSTMIALNTQIISYQCPPIESRNATPYVALQYSPILSRIYDANLILTIEDSDSD
jgi:hypothetical protein